VAALSDDIAYDAHDIDDGLRAELFSLDDIAAVPVIGDILHGIEGLDSGRRAHETVRALDHPHDRRRHRRDRAARGGAQAERDRSAPSRGPLIAFSPAMQRRTKRSRVFSIRACTATRG